MSEPLVRGGEIRTPMRMLTAPLGPASTEFGCLPVAARQLDLLCEMHPMGRHPGEVSRRVGADSNDRAREWPERSVNLYDHDLAAPFGLSPEPREAFRELIRAGHQTTGVGPVKSERYCPPGTS